MAEAFAADDVGDRLAPQAPPHHLAEQPRRRSRDLGAGIGDQSSTIDTRRLRKQYFSVQARVFDTGRRKPIRGRF